MLYGNSSEVQNCPVGDDVLRAVRHEQCHAIAFAYTECAQAGGNAANLGIQLGIGGGATEEGQCLAARVVAQSVAVDI